MASYLDVDDIPFDGILEKVLDHGFVRLVEHCGNDLSIVRAARVSYNADWRTGSDTGSDEKLISYLIRNRHTSPFESVTFTFEIKCPIFVARQWQRHRTWKYNEVSARYTELPEEFYVPSVEQVRAQSSTNKQGSGEAFQPYDAELFRGALETRSKDNFVLYRDALKQGVARELARCFLPLNTYTRYFGTVDLHNLLHFLSLRLHPHAQWEIQQYAQALFNRIKPIVPITIKHWSNNFLNEIAKS